MKDVIVSSDWPKAAEGIDEETLLKGIAAYSEIVALPCHEYAGAAGWERGNETGIA